MQINRKDMSAFLRLFFRLILPVLLLTSCASGPVSAPVAQRNRALNEQTLTYQVMEGDTLYSIAWQTRKDIKLLASWNGINPPYTIYPGQKIRFFREIKHQKRAVTAARAVRYEKKKEIKTSKNQPIKKNLKKSLKVHWRWPLIGSLDKRFSSKEGRDGIDISARKDVIVKAAADGKIVYSGSGLIGYGNLLIIKHNEEFLSAYGFNRRLLAKEGAFVKAGEKIAEAGLVAGRRKLHFEIRRKGKPVNPLRYLPPRK